MAKRILVVDDEEDVVNLVRVNLELAGHAVHVARNGQDGLDLMDEVAPDLVLLDVMMPVLDGWATLRELTEDPDTRAIPVVMLTALSSERDVIRGHLGGAVRYVTKPFDLDLLLQTVEEALQPVDDDERARRLETRTGLLRRLAELEAGRSEPQAVRVSHLDGVPRDSVREISESDRERLARLTGRQAAVAGMLGAGSSARDVAESFGVSRSNVYATRKRIARKLGVDPDSVPGEARRLGIEPPAS